jgi:hypothetical protein
MATVLLIAMMAARKTLTRRNQERAVAVRLMWIATAMEYLTVTMDARLTLKRQNQERVAVERLRRILTTMASQTALTCAPTTFTRPIPARADATSRILMPTAMEHLTAMIFAL